MISMEKLHSSLETIAQRHPSNIAVITKNGHFSYKFIDDLSTALATTLVREYGVSPGDRIALMIPDKVFFLIAYYAISKAEAIVIPIDHLLKNCEIQYVINHSTARFLLTDNTVSVAHLLEGISCKERTSIRLTVNEDDHFSCYSLCKVKGSSQLQQYENKMNTDVAVITYTSGTTGVPKGVVITHGSIVEKMHSFNEVLRLNSRDRILSELSIVYIYGQIMVMNLGIWYGCTLVLLDGKNTEEIVTCLEKERITVMFSIPITYTSMNDYIRSHNIKVGHNLRYAITGGNLLTVGRKKEIEESLEVKLLDSYGLTETTASVIMENPHERRKIGSIGKKLSGCSVQLWDEDGMELPPGQIGEIVVKTSGMMDGYYRDNYIQSTSFTDGWFHTGDLGYQDIDGYFFIVDRRKDIIKTLGFVVSPSEVEEVLLSHSDVQDAAVIGVQDETCDELIKAFVMRKPHVQLKVGDLHQYLSRHLASFKCPSIYEFVEVLPRNNSGKLLKELLK